LPDDGPAFDVDGLLSLDDDDDEDAAALLEDAPAARAASAARFAAARRSCSALHLATNALSSASDISRLYLRSTYGLTVFDSIALATACGIDSLVMLLVPLPVFFKIDFVGGGAFLGGV